MYLRLLFLSVLLGEESLHGVLFNTITLFQGMFMWSSNPIAFAISTIAIDSLNGVVSCTIGTCMTWTVSILQKGHTTKLLCLLHLPSWLALGKEVVGLRWISSFRAELCMTHWIGEKFCDLDLDIAEIPFSSSALALLLVWVVGFGGSWGTSFESAVPVMRNERLSPNQPL